MVLKRLRSSHKSAKAKEESESLSQIQSSGARRGPKHSIMRVSNLDESLHQLGLAPSKKFSNSSVSFGAIRIRDYERVAGDNPSETGGVPISIGWRFIEYNDIPVEEYEKYHDERRTKGELVMNAQDRHWLLRQDWNVSQKEIAHAVRTTVRARNQRKQTIIKDEMDERMLRRLKSIVNGFKSVLAVSSSSATEKELYDDEDTEDWMERAAVYQQKGVLDKTRHRGSSTSVDLLEEENDVIENVAQDDFLKKDLDNTVDSSMSGQHPIEC